MERGYQSLLLEGEYPLSPQHDQNAVVYSTMYPAYVAKPEPFDFGFCQLPDLRSLEQLYKYNDDVPAAKRAKRSPEREIKARQRRQSISDKLRCLQKLLPCERKMDTGTMLEEASKYVRFLQAQVSVLQSMPPTNPSVQVSDKSYVFGGGLGRLTRQQLLEVFLNSHVAQSVLYRRECCIYSTEQLALLQRVVAEKNTLSWFLSQHQF